MKSVKHTPGPWIAATANEDTILKGPRGEPVAYLYPRPELGDEIGQNAPNARLIAAAPEQNDALREVLPLLEQLIDQGVLPEDSQVTVRVRAAIAKAEGRSE